MLPEGAGVPVLYRDPLMPGGGDAELVQETEGHGGGDQRYPRPPVQHRLKGGTVVGLHVVDDHVIQRPAVQQVLQIFHQLAAGGPVHRVEENGGLVQQKVGIVADPPGDGMDILKQGQPPVVGAHPIKLVGHLAYTIHKLR